MAEKEDHAGPVAGKVFEFDGFRLDAQNRLLSRAGERLALPARAFDTLLILVQRPAELVTKNDLLDLVWADSFVEESNLTVAISNLRRVLGEDPQDRRFIQTVSGRGYRFISEVSVVGPAKLEPAPAEAAPGVTEPVRVPVPVPAIQAPVPAPPRRKLYLVAALLVLFALVAAVVGWRMNRARAEAARRQTAAAVPAPHRMPVSPEAYQLYLRGRYFWNRRTEDGLRRSIEAFRQSIQVDPNYAPAYAGLADSYSLLASFSVESGRTANPDARAAALSAIQLDPTLAEPHASLGMIYFFTDWNGPAAEQEFIRAIALNPDYATAHHWYALDLAAMGRFPQALAEIHRAQELDPLSLIISTNVGWIQYLNHQNDRAITEYRKALELDPSFVRARTRLGIAEIQAGNYTAAIEDLQAAEKAASDPYISGLLGEAQARAGHTAAAEKILAGLQTRASTKYVPPFALALIYIGLDRRPEALKALQQAAEDRSTSMVYAKIDPSLDSLRTDPEFQAILSTMRF